MNFNFLKIRIHHQNLIPIKILSKSNNFNINYLGTSANNKNIKLSKEKINHFAFEGEEKQNIKKNIEFIEESLDNINYIGKTFDSKKEDKYTSTENLDFNQDYKNKKEPKDIFIIEKNHRINYPKVKQNINNILNMEKKDNFLYQGNDKDIKEIERNNLVSKKIDDINYQAE